MQLVNVEEKCSRKLTQAHDFSQENSINNDKSEKRRREQAMAPEICVYVVRLFSIFTSYFKVSQVNNCK